MRIFPRGQNGGLWAALWGGGLPGKVRVASSERHLGALIEAGSRSNQGLTGPCFKRNVRNIVESLNITKTTKQNKTEKLKRS